MTEQEAEKEFRSKIVSVRKGRPLFPRQRSQAERNALFNEHVLLAYKFAACYWKRPVGKRVGSYEDCVQHCLMGLLHAAELFDARQGFRFSTYAYRAMYSHLQRGASDARLIGIPAQYLNGSNKCVDHKDEVVRAYHVQQFPVGLFDDGDAWEPLAPVRHYMEQDERQEVLRALQRLRPRLRLLLMLRFGISPLPCIWKGEEVGLILGVSKQRVDQLWNQAAREFMKAYRTEKDVSRGRS